MLVCAKCGYDNELGRIFCHSCGTKLDLSQVKPPGQGGPKLRRRTRGQVWRYVRGAIELAVCAAIIYAIYLMWQVPAAPAAKPTSADMLSAEKKRFELERLITRGKPGKIEVTGRELNAFLGSMAMDKPKAGWLAFAPETVRMELGDGTVKVMLWGELRLGDDLKKQLYLSYTCAPSVADGVLDHKPVAAALGSLPIHVGIVESTPVIQNALGAVLGKLDRERDTLQKLHAIIVSRDRVSLEYESRVATTPAPAR